MSRSYRHGNRQKEKYKKYQNPYMKWWQQEPKWWRKMMKHKKRRASQRECISEVYKGNEEVLFPLDKKPWIYYW